MRAQFLLFPAVLLGCGGTTVVASSAGTGAGSTSITGAGGGGASGTGGSTAGTGGGTVTGSTSSSATGTAGAPPACAAPSPGAGDHMATVQSGSDMRTYLVHVPPTYDATKPTTLVLLFHGFTETSAGIESLTEFDPVSDKHGFLTVYPQGIDDSFNAGTCCGDASATQVDDMQFVSDMLDQLAQDYCIDQKRVFASGFSNGGMMSHRLACQMSERIAAIGAVSGTLAISPCTPTRPVPVLHIHGTADPIVAYTNGGLSGAEGVPQTISTWVGIDGCTDAMPATVFTNGDATCTAYTMCQAGTAVELCTINGGGHQWPGGMTDFIGLLSTDLDASETIAEFFDAHPMP